MRRGATLCRALLPEPSASPAEGGEQLAVSPQRERVAAGDQEPARGAATESREARSRARPFGAAGRLDWAGARGLLIEAVLLGLALAAYYAVRLLVRGSGAAPQENALALVRLESVLHLDWEQSLQQAFLAHLTPVVHVLNFVYAWGYWVILAGSLAYLYLRHRDCYRTLRNTIIISGCVGFFIFASFPVAPPRLADVGIVDTVRLGGSVLEQVARPNALTNQNAAMPSFHFGWILLCGICLSMSARRWFTKLLPLVLPLLMGLTIIVTGNHYVIDAVVGGALCLLALVPWRLQRRAPSKQPYELA